MHIGFALNEFLAVATALSGLLAVAWRVRQRRGATTRPLVGGLEFFVGRWCSAAAWRWPTGSACPRRRWSPRRASATCCSSTTWPTGPAAFTNTALPMGRPQRGDVAVFRYPHQVSQFYVKRLVALAGDVVEFRDGLVAVNGEPFVARDAGASEHPADLGQRLLRETSAGRDRTIKLDPRVRGRLPMTIDSPDCIEARAGHWRCTVPAGPCAGAGRQPRSVGGFENLGFPARAGRSTDASIGCCSTTWTGTAGSSGWSEPPVEPAPARFGEIPACLFGPCATVPAHGPRRTAADTWCSASPGHCLGKAAELTRELGRAGATVQVVMTEAAEHFITAVTCRPSQAEVATSQWDARQPNNMAHINLTRGADAILVALRRPTSSPSWPRARGRPAVAAVRLARPLGGQRPLQGCCWPRR